MITVIDYEMGNLGSIANIIRKLGEEAEITSDQEQLRKASKLILPGVGHFDRGMENLSRLNLVPILEEAIFQRQVPILGICLGMQLMCHSSEEGARPGLGWVDAHVKRFRPQSPSELKVPHMGWNIAKVLRGNSLLNMEPVEPDRFYFVHSYYVDCQNHSDVVATTEYGIEFCSAFQKKNVLGVQFHPEKSHVFGMDLFRKFLVL